MKQRIIKTMLLGLGCLLLCSNNSVYSQSSITIEASQQITNFVFKDGSGVQDNTYLLFGSDNLYKSSYSGAYSFGYSYELKSGLFFRGKIGVRNAGATMVFDASNYEWDFKYLNFQLGMGYVHPLGTFNRYIAVQGYFASLLKANQRINNEDFDIIDSNSIQRGDIGLNIPLGVKIDVWDDIISVYTEVSYLVCLKNIEKESNGQESHNVGYMFTLGLAFHL